MYRINESNRGGCLLEEFLHSKCVSSLRLTEGTTAAISSMQTMINQIHRDPEAIRIMTQAEFDYQGVVDGSSGVNESGIDPLHVEWYDSTFSIANYSKAPQWVEKACREAEKGKTIVMLIPARTNSKWFHEKVLEQATEVRFIQGNVIINGNPKSTVPDCLVVYKRIENKPMSGKGSVAIVGMRTSFTSTDNEMVVE